MATYVLIHGAGGDSWYWHRVVPELRARGHDVVVPDLPADDDKAGFPEYADVVVEAIGDRRGLILVAQSMAGFTAPIVSTRLPVELIILVNAMVPKPGESGGEWWTATGQAEAQRELDLRDGRDPDAPFDPLVTFGHDVPPEIWAESEGHVKQQSGTPFADPWPLDAWPDVPTRALLCRDDRLFPADFMRRLVKERLGITAAEMDGGHLPALAHPRELVEHLEAFRVRNGAAPAS